MVGLYISIFLRVGNYNVFSRMSHILNHFSLSNQSIDPVKNIVNNTNVSMNEIKDKLVQMVGKEIGTTSWIEIKQNNVDTFAKITDADYNYIHQKDSQQKGSPFGPPIAQGMYILALVDSFNHEIRTRDSNVELFSLKYKLATINQGFNKVLFIAPSYIENCIRAIYRLKNIKFGKKQNSIQVVFDITVQMKDKHTQKISNMFQLLCMMHLTNFNAHYAASCSGQVEKK
eukprot:222482_1